MPSGYDKSPDYGGPEPTWRGIIIGVIIMALVLFVIGWRVAHAAECTVSLDTVRKQMIAESVAAYPGNCPCPYFTDRAGRSCGRRSAYSRPGGYAPLCYLGDIRDADAEAYCASHGGQ